MNLLKFSSIFALPYIAATKNEASNSGLDTIVGHARVKNEPNLFRPEVRSNKHSLGKIEVDEDTKIDSAFSTENTDPNDQTDWRSNLSHFGALATSLLAGTLAYKQYSLKNAFNLKVSGSQETINQEIKRLQLQLNRHYDQWCELKNISDNGLLRKVLELIEPEGDIKNMVSALTRLKEKLYVLQKTFSDKPFYTLTIDTLDHEHAEITSEIIRATETIKPLLEQLLASEKLIARYCEFYSTSNQLKLTSIMSTIEKLEQDANKSDELALTEPELEQLRTDISIMHSKLFNLQYDLTELTKSVHADHLLSPLNSKLEEANRLLETFNDYLDIFFSGDTKDQNNSSELSSTSKKSFPIKEVSDEVKDADSELSFKM